MSDKAPFLPSAFNEWVDTPVTQLATQSFSTWLTSVTRFQAETMRFFASRFAKDLQIPARFAACKTPADLAQVQLQAMSDAMEDYVEEGRRLVELMGAELEDTAAIVG